MQEEYKKIYLSSPTMCGKEMQYIQEAFHSNWVAPLGSNVDELENEIKKRVCSSYALALNSGTAALHLALKGVGVKQGDIVFCSDLTFAASCNPICYEAGIPVFIDGEKKSWNMSPRALENAFEYFKRPKAVIVVHLYGTPANMKELKAICDYYHVSLIEDAAESLGAAYEGIQTGTFGAAGVYSFNGNKIITTSGGGMLVSNEKSLIENARKMSAQSREPFIHYEHKEIGYNYRLSNISAGIGRGQLTVLDDYIKKKENLYSTYKTELEKMDGVTMNPIPKECKANYWLSCILLDKNIHTKPLDIIHILKENHIESRPIWKPMHLQPVFRNYCCVTEQGVFKNMEKFESVSEDIYQRGVCLPSDIKNTKKDMERIIHIIKKKLNG